MLLSVFAAICSFPFASASKSQIERRSSSPIISQYWPDWTAQSQPPSSIPFAGTQFALFFASATTSDSSGFELPDSNLMKSFGSACRSNNVIPLLSIGGWSGSVYFSQLVSTAAKRQAFSSAIKSYLTQYSLYGVDLDWEYPGQSGAGSNVVSPQDSANLLLFLGSLRAALGSSKYITAAVPTSPWVGSNGNPLADVSKYARFLNYINLMAYDINGQWSDTTGPNAPLHAQYTSGETAVQAWTKAGFPASRILLGVPSYALSFTTVSSTLATTTPGGCTATSMLYQQKTQPTGACSYGCTYLDLISIGFLSQDGTTGAHGFTRYFDSCSATPFIFNPTTKELISYDDIASVQAKAAFALQHSLAGIYIFSSLGFTNNIYAAARATLNGNRPAAVVIPPSSTTTSTKTTSTSTSTLQSSTKVSSSSATTSLSSSSSFSRSSITSAPSSAISRSINSPVSSSTSSIIKRHIQRH